MLALEFHLRYPTIPASLVLASAYAGWAGSLPPDAVERRLRQALELAELTPDRLVKALLPTMFLESASTEILDEFGASLSEFHPVGFRVMARSFAEADLHDVLPHIEVPTLLL